MSTPVPDSMNAARLREVVARPLDGWRELYDDFAPKDAATGVRTRRVPESLDGARRAAVLVPVVMRPEGPTLLYTVRKSSLSDHAGQISFPGGGVDPLDGSLAATALREAQEEVDLDRNLVEVIGELEDMYIPPSNFLVKPVVGLLPVGAELSLSPEEVEELFEVPLETLLAPETFRRVLRERDGRHFEVPLFRVESGGSAGYEIWGATAAITAALLSRLGWKIPAR